MDVVVRKIVWARRPPAEHSLINFEELFLTSTYEQAEQLLIGLSLRDDFALGQLCDAHGLVLKNYPPTSTN